MNTVQEAGVRQLGHFVGGAMRGGAGGRWGDVFNPAAGTVTARVALASRSEVEAAIAAAHAAFPGWSETSPLRRARIMFKFKALLEKHADEISALITAEHGKVLSDARGELTRGIEVVEFACGIPHLQKGEFSEQIGTGIDSWSMRQPLGV